MNTFHRLAQRVVHAGRRVLAQRPLTSALLGGMGTSAAAVMVGLAVGQFATGDTVAGFGLVAAAIVALLWRWAEYRAGTAYDTGWSSGVDAVKHSTLDLLSDAFQSIGDAAARQREEGDHRG